MRILVSYFTGKLSSSRFLEIFHHPLLQWLDKIKSHLASSHFFNLYFWGLWHTKKVCLPSVSAHFCVPKALKIKIQKSAKKQGGF